MSIYTRGGDGGETRLGDGSLVRKSDARIEAYGALDEAIVAVGCARAATHDPTLADALKFVQQKLMNCSASVASADAGPDTGRPSASAELVSAHDVTAAERLTERMLPAADGEFRFVLPGGCETACRCHVARTAVRRAERRLDAAGALAPQEPVRAFVNRCSDLLYAAALYANKLENRIEQAWDPQYSAEQG